jgi:hypothetical protein
MLDEKRKPTILYSSPFEKMVALAGDIDFSPKKTLKGEENI